MPETGFGSLNFRTEKTQRQKLICLPLRGNQGKRIRR